MTDVAFADGSAPDPVQLDVTTDQPITVHVDAQDQDQTLNGHEFKAVQLATYSKAFGFTGASGRVTSLDVATTPALKDAINASITAEHDTANPMAWVVANLMDSHSSPWAGKLRDFLNALNAQDAFKTDAGTALAVNAAGTAATADVAPGVYAIVDTTNAKGTPAAVIAMNGTGIQGLTTLQGTAEGAQAYTLGTVEYKVHKTTVDKTVDSASKALDPHDAVAADGADKGHAVSTMLGKAIPFKITSTVPNWTGYTKYYYGINDSYTKGLDIDADTVAVTVGGKTLDPQYYTVTNTPAAGAANGTLQVVFGKSADKGDILPSKDMFPVGAAVVVTYTAMLNANAVSTNTETNKATVQYSQNPNDWTDHRKTPETTDKVYTGFVDIAKHDMDGKALTGAEFQASDATGASTAPIRFVKVGDGDYRVATGKDATTTETLAVSGTGTLHIDGIAKSFTLKETKSPFSGAYLPQAVIDAEVNPSDGTVATTVTAKDRNGMVGTSTDGGNTNQIVVQNARNLAEMPKTGATWMTIFIAGIVALLAVGTLLIVRSRMKDSAR